MTSVTKRTKKIAAAPATEIEMITEITSTESSNKVIVVDFASASVPVSDVAKAIAAEAQTLVEGGKRAIKDLAQSRSDISMVNPFDIRIEDGLNSRDLTDPENLARIDVLAQSIAAKGVLKPLVIFRKGDFYFVADGHRRLLGTLRAINVYGAEIKRIPVVLEARGTTQAERILMQITHNDEQKPLELLERATVYKKLHALGWSLDEIAKQIGKSRVHVADAIDLSGKITNDLRKAISDGVVRTSAVRQLLKDHNDDAVAAYNDIVAAKAINKDRTRVMPTQIRMARAAREPSAAMTKVPVLPKFDRIIVEGALSRATVVEDGEHVVITMSKTDYALMRGETNA